MLLKKIAYSLGLYPVARLAIAYSLGLYPIRLVHRHLVDRSDLVSYKTKLSFFGQLIREDDLVFDIGANLGALTEVFLDLGAKVVACEPQPDCFRELMARHAARHGLIATNCALGATRGKAKFYIRRARGTSGLVENWHPEVSVRKVIDVEVVTLDELINKYSIPKYCKIDVEGYEYEVLKGLSKAIPVVSLEYHTSQSDIEKSIECLNYLSRFGNLAVNVTSAENFRFLFAEWVSRDYFIEFFTKHIGNLSGFDFGDIFVKIQN